MPRQKLWRDESLRFSAGALQATLEQLARRSVDHRDLLEARLQITT
jgi:hypothetical protein